MLVIITKANIASEMAPSAQKNCATVINIIAYLCTYISTRIYNHVDTYIMAHNNYNNYVLAYICSYMRTYGKMDKKANEVRSHAVAIC